MLAWIVTSRFRVGSSAIRNSAPQARANAMITRCRCPPESWWGYFERMLSASASLTSRSRETASCVACFRPRPRRLVRSTSDMMLPTVKTGLRQLMGSWKIMAIRLPRTLRWSWRGLSFSRSCPSRRISPDSIRPGGQASSFWIARASTVLPWPDSPTRP